MNPGHDKSLADALARIPHIQLEADSLAILTDFAAQHGKSGADLVFMKVNTEPGWTLESGQALADAWVVKYMEAATDSVHAQGGTVETAQRMVQAAVTAFGQRLQELAASWGEGGRA